MARITDIKFDMAVRDARSHLGELPSATFYTALDSFTFGKIRETSSTSFVVKTETRDFAFTGSGFTYKKGEIVGGTITGIRLVDPTGTA